MHTFDTDTGAIAYELLEATEPTAGQPSPTLTLIHNFMSTGRSAWGTLLPVLNRRHRILLPDLPGHGRSTGYPPGFHHWAIARQLAALMRSVDAQDGHLAGSSSGGMIAQLLVHHRMVQPRTLTLVSTTYSTDPARTGATTALQPENFQAGSAWLEATARLHDPVQGEGYYAGTLLPGFRALTPATSIDLTRDDLHHFALPVCLIHGERDEFFPPTIPQAMAVALPDAELHIIPRQTHALIFRQPWKVAELMETFLRRHG
jgi:3-oxoadipate enol-lactonase